MLCLMYAEIHIYVREENAAEFWCYSKIFVMHINR